MVASLKVVPGSYDHVVLSEETVLAAHHDVAVVAQQFLLDYFQELSHFPGLFVQIFVFPVHIYVAIDKLRSRVAEVVGLFVLVLLEGGSEVVGEESIAVLGI